MASDEPKWKQIGSFELSGDKLNEVLIVVDGKVMPNITRYADCLTKELSHQWPGRYTSKGQKSRKESPSLKFQFVRSCHITGCLKKWRISCSREKFFGGKVDFIVEDNSLDCNCVHRPQPRPVSGKSKVIWWIHICHNKLYLIVTYFRTKSWWHYKGAINSVEHAITPQYEESWVGGTACSWPKSSRTEVWVKLY